MGFITLHNTGSGDNGGFEAEASLRELLEDSEDCL